MLKVVPVKSFEVKLFINGIGLTAGELKADILRGLDKQSICVDEITIEEVPVIKSEYDEEVETND